MLEHMRTTTANVGRVVVLGARGFVGRALVARLRQSKIPVRGVGSAEIDLAADGAAAKFAELLKSDDTIVFLSALTPDKGRGIPPFLANLRMAAALCVALEKVAPAHLVYVSSDAVYPFRTGLISEDTPAEPADLYGAMHLSRELMVKQAGKLPVAILRPTLIYGAGDTHNSYGPNRLRRMAHKDGRITLFGEGEETRDHIFIDDVVALIELVICNRSVGTLNLASGGSISYSDLARKVAAQFNKMIEIVGTPRQNAATHRAFDITALYRTFPTFRFTPLETGLAAAQGDLA
jgi:UDP-glucose 4-epimerase